MMQLKAYKYRISPTEEQKIFIGIVWQCPHSVQVYLMKPALVSRQSLNLLIEFLMYSKWLWVKKGLIKFKICGKFAMDSISLIMRY